MGDKFNFLVPMETSTCTGNCQSDSRIVKDEVGNKKTNFFSKAKTTLKNKCPLIAQLTGVSASMQVIGRTCSKPISSQKVPSSWRRGSRKEEYTVRSATTRAEQTNEKQFPSPKTEFEMPNPKASCSHTINETGKCVAAVKDIKITIFMQVK
jgi:hypothetical protein